MIKIYLQNSTFDLVFYQTALILQKETQQQAAQLITDNDTPNILIFIIN